MTFIIKNIIILSKTINKLSLLIIVIDKNISSLKFLSNFLFNIFIFSKNMRTEDYYDLIKLIHLYSNCIISSHELFDLVKDYF
jgi:hypothetical protein